MGDHWQLGLQRDWTGSHVDILPGGRPLRESACGSLFAEGLDATKSCGVKRECTSCPDSREQSSRLDAGQGPEEGHLFVQIAVSSPADLMQDKVQRKVTRLRGRCTAASLADDPSCGQAPPTDFFFFFLWTKKKRKKKGIEKEKRKSSNES